MCVISYEVAVGQHKYCRYNNIMYIIYIYRYDIQYGALFHLLRLSQGEAAVALQSKLERADADLKRSRSKESQKDREIHHLEIFGKNSRRLKD